MFNAKQKKLIYLNVFYYLAHAPLYLFIVLMPIQTRSNAFLIAGQTPSVLTPLRVLQHLPLLSQYPLFRRQAFQRQPCLSPCRCLYHQAPRHQRIRREHHTGKHQPNVAQIHCGLCICLAVGLCNGGQAPSSTCGGQQGGGLHYKNGLRDAMHDQHAGHAPILQILALVSMLIIN